jgi:carbon-monoxide dehydrogenase large subunit
MTTTIAPPKRRTGIDVLRTDEYRVEGRDKVTGAGQYSADFTRPQMLWAALLRSPVPHARIRSIDTAAARALPGVHAVLTGADIGEHYLGRALLDWPVLAIDRVRFIGDHVAAVAADSAEIAAEAVRLIEVDYDELPAIFDPHDALADDAIVLHERPERYPFLYGPSRPPASHPNVQGRVELKKGDVEAGFAQAARVFEHRFTTPAHHPGYIEPRATLVWIADDGRVHVVSTNKSPFALRKQLAVSTGLPEEQFVVEPSYIGGDFGGKGLSVDEFICYHLARATSRPVKAVRSYLDDVQATNVRHPAEIVLKTGVDAEGRFVAFSGRVLFNGGAYAAGKPIPTLVPGFIPNLPYRIPNAAFEMTAVYTNTVPGGHVRAPADVQALFAIESHVDMIAHELGIDPLEFRLRNAIAGNETDISGSPYLEPRAVDLLQELRRATDWGRPLPENRGRGIALTVRHIGGGATSLRLRVTRRGDVEVETGTVEQGSGMFTVIARVLEASLGIDPARVRVVRNATDRALADPGAGASRVTHIVGQAVLDGAAKLRAQLELAGWDGSPETWDDAARSAAGRNGPLEVIGSFRSHDGPGEAHAFNFSAFLADVSVDRATGEVTLNEVVYVADVGAIINPVGHRGQLNGGFVYGLGHALTEELRIEDGKIVNLSLGEYKLPTQADLPPLRTILVETHGGPGPFGAKMAGETSTAGVAPAIANAVAAACGARITSLPITAERIYRALHPPSP